LKFPLKSEIRQGCPLSHFYLMYNWDSKPEQ
jgi:hypothetical protein